MKIGQEKVDCNNTNITNEKKVVTGITKFDNLFNDEVRNYTLAWNKLYRKELFETIKFKKGKFHEDIFFAHHILDKAQVIVASDAVLYYYRQRMGSITKEFSLKRMDDIEGLKDRVNFFKEKYKDTKYVSLATIAYADNIIKVYSLCYYNREKNNHKDALRDIKKIYDNHYKEIINAANNKKLKLKYIIFKIFPFIIYSIYIYKNKLILKKHKGK